MTVEAKEGAALRRDPQDKDMDVNEEQEVLGAW